MLLRDSVVLGDIANLFGMVLPTFLVDYFFRKQALR